MSVSIQDSVFCEFELGDPTQIENMKLFYKKQKDSEALLEKIKNDKADAHCILQAKKRVCASLWWKNTPLFQEGKVGLIGHWNAPSFESTKKLLERCCLKLKAKGCDYAIGPMDGSTWRNYRFRVEKEGPSFFMEPDNPIDWPEFFQQCGFKVIANFNSTLVTNLLKRDPRALRMRDRFEKNKVRFRSLNMNQFEGELNRIYELSVLSFRKNYLFTTPSRKEFINYYSQFKDKLVPEFIFLAEKENQLVGFLFAIPDFSQITRPGGVDTIIGKTLARLPGREYAGLGIVLIENLHRTSEKFGYFQVIHALQHEKNRIQTFGNFHGHILRRYVLLGKKLDK